MKIPVSKPLISNKATKYVNEALSEKSLSGLYGKFIPKFEEEFADYCGTKHAISCSSGTAALHLPLAASGLKKGDEVLVSTLTNMATFFAVIYTGAKPVPVDIDTDTLNISFEDLKRKVTKRTKAILLVHLFGHPADLNPILEFAKSNNLDVFEDCAEAHGAEYHGKKVGGFGKAGCFSLFANKIITAGEGGVITTNDDDLNLTIRNLKSLAFGDKDKFQHKDIGYNYRFSNIQAAVACEQLENISHLVKKRIEIAEFYNKEFESLSDFISLPIQRPHSKNVYWMYHMVLKPNEKLFDKRNEICKELLKKGIETRQGFVPFNLQKIFIDKKMTEPNDCPNANATSGSSFYIPTGPDISEKELKYVASNFLEIIDKLIN
mgnify:FL=1